MIFGRDRNTMRRVYIDAWRKHRAGELLEPMENVIVQVIGNHPEHHAVIEAGKEALERDYLPELGQINPFLHLSLHVAIAEQLATDRPSGIVDAHRHLCLRLGNPHDAEHQMMECLAEILWQAQRDGVVPEEQAYLRGLAKIG